MLSGEWEKNRCKWQYEIVFGDIQNPGTWKKMNSVTKKERELARIVIWEEEEERLGKFVQHFETIQVKSKISSDSTRPAIIARCKKLNINLQLIEGFIMNNARIIIHIHLN